MEDNSKRLTLIDAYKTTTYVVFNSSIAIRINEYSSELDEYIIQNGGNTWAFITPYNPGSIVLSEEENIIRFEELRKDIIDYSYLEGEGIGNDTSWKPERSFLVAGIDIQEASFLGRKYEQLAILYGEINSPAQLLVLE